MPENKPADVILLPRSVNAVARPSLPDHGKIKPNRYDDGGDPPMKDDYVTHEELDHAVDKLADKIDKLEISLNAKFDVTNSKFDTLNNRIDSLSKIVWWIMGIISAGIIVPLLAFVFKAIFNS